MTRIPSQPHAPQANGPDPGSATRQRREDGFDASRDPFRRRGERESAMRDGLARGGTQGSPGHEPSGAETFRRFVRGALDDQETGERDRHGGGGEHRLLAVAEAPVGSVFGLFAPSPVSTASGDAVSSLPQGGVVEQGVGELVARIELAERAELRQGTASLDLRIALDGLVEGLQAVGVRLTPDGLDVTLVRATGDATLDLGSAAQELANRLQARFARRRVRILEAELAPEEGAVPAGDGLSAIARLLGDRGHA